jgi:hypothetical protein
MLSALIAYMDNGAVDVDGVPLYDVIAMKPMQRAPNPDGTWRFRDFEEMELAGEEFTDVWIVEKWPGEYGVGTPQPARGSKSWPEWIDRTTDFRVRLEGPPGRKRIAALVHMRSGHRRERRAIDEAIAGRIRAAQDAAIANGPLLRELYVDAGVVSSEEAHEIPDPDPDPVDLRDILGGPTRPLSLDDDGRTVGRGPVTEDLASLVTDGVDEAVDAGAEAEGDGGGEPEVGLVDVAVAPGEEQQE